MRLPIVASLLLGALCRLADAQTPSSASRLEDFILVNLASSQDGADATFPPDWCLAATSDHSYNWWPFGDTSTETVATTRVRRSLRIPFAHQGYGGQAFGAILVGFEASGESETMAVETTRTPPRPSAAAPRPLSCGLGDFILSEAPLPITLVPLAVDIAKVTMIDPAPDYRWWYFRGQPLRVRTILYIPVKYRAATGETAGHIVVSFGEGG